MQKETRFFSTKRLTVIAILASIAIVLYFPPLQIPIVLFYKLDFSNIPVLLGTFSMGPLTGMLILLLKSTAGLLFSSSLGVGELADFLMGLAMILPAGLIYRHRKSRKNAVIGMAVGSVAATAAGVLLNVYLLIPFYAVAFNMPVEAIIAMGQSVVAGVDSVWKMVFLITAPFNVLKWTAISLVGGVVYKPLSPILHGKTAFRP